MNSCAFFGHRDYPNYESEIGDKLDILIEKLITEDGVTEFFNGYRGNFDLLCAQKISEFKKRFPHIRNILVLSYLNREKDLAKCFDESIYLLEDFVPPRYAISRTNRLLVNYVNIIISGVKYTFGGAWEACEFARRQKKIIYNVFDL